MDKSRITVAALGPGHPGLVTRAAWEALTGGARVVLRTARHGVAQELTRAGVAFETLDELYEMIQKLDK